MTNTNKELTQLKNTSSSLELKHKNQFLNPKTKIQESWEHSSISEVYLLLVLAKRHVATVFPLDTINRSKCKYHKAKLQLKALSLGGGGQTIVLYLSEQKFSIVCYCPVDTSE